MTAPSASLAWGWVESLGHSEEAPRLLRTWLGALGTAEGDHLLLEQGEGPGGPFLRARGRPSLLLQRPPGGSPTGLRVRLAGISPDGAEALPPFFHPRGARAYGRLLLGPDPDLGPEGEVLRGRDGVHLGAAAGPVGVLPSGAEVGHAVQAFVRALGPGGPFRADVRVLAEADAHRPDGPDLARRCRDRVGTAWATALGAGFEPWAPGSRAHDVAEAEWGRRVVVRFHSGPAGPLTLGRLAAPWAVPATVEGPRPPRETFPPSPAAPRSAPAVKAAMAADAGPSSPAPSSGVHLGAGWSTGAPWRIEGTSLLRHVAVVGMTGSGKTQLLAHLADGLRSNGWPFVLFDLHGDLGPTLLGRLPREDRRDLVVMDGTRPPEEGLLGVDVLDGSHGSSPLSDLDADRLSGEVLSALRPLGGGREDFWGPRMERYLESALRAVMAAGGNLADVAELLHDPGQRSYELTRTVQLPAVRRFLEELPGLHRRQPDLLTSSQNRLAKLLLSRTVQGLVAPPRARALLPEHELAQGRSLLLHLPKGRLGESTATFVANLLLARIYLGLLRGPARGDRPGPRAALVLDEAQVFAPRLLRSIVEEGRKFGVACILATQSPGRLVELFDGAPVDGVGTLVVLRLPPGDAARVLPSLCPGRAARSGPASAGAETPEGWVTNLATLPPHAGWVRSDGRAVPELLALPYPRGSDPEAWSDAASRSAGELPKGPMTPAVDEDLPLHSWEEGCVRGLLLRAAEAEARGAPLTPPDDDGPRSPFLSAWTPGRWATTRALAEERGWLSAREDGVARLTPRGWARLGYQEDLGAPRESAEHRRLLFVAFRLFARHGVTLELPPQGRMDRTTPDARVGLLEALGLPSTATPGELRDVLVGSDRLWLWRLGRGRDLHVEAEVSRAGDGERMARLWEKARRARAFLLVVTDRESSGRRVRRWLRTNGVGPDRSEVWVLRPGTDASVAEGPGASPAPR